MKLPIKVTQEHITLARKLYSEAHKVGSNYRLSLYCPIALAIKSHFPDSSCSRTVIWIKDNDMSSGCIDLPEIAMNFIKDFDDILTSVKPIEFELDTTIQTIS